MDISVIVPFYKGNAYMQQLLGVLRENAKHAPDLQIELLLVNDSPGCPVEYDSAWVQGFDLRILENPENVGIQQTRVNGLRQAKGTCIQFLDQDDTLEPEALASQYSLLGNNDLILSNGYNENKGAHVPMYLTEKQQRLAASPRFYYTVSNQIASPGQTLIRKASIPQQWCESCIGRNGSDDLLLWLMLFHRKAHWQINPRCLYTHKDTGHTLSDDIGKMVESSGEVLQVLQRFSMITPRQSRQFRSSRKMAAAYISKSPLHKLVAMLRHPVITWNRFLLRLESL